jgi:putative methyltransferase (TIGR04325 family)
VKDLRWSVVDQPAHVACGQADFANEQLRFYKTIDDCLRVENPSVLLLLSVLQYLPRPYAFLEEIVRREIPHVIVARTPFARNGSDRLTLQHVPAWIYKATLPAWFLSEPSFRRGFEEKYGLICEYTTGQYPSRRGTEACFKGFQFQLRTAPCRGSIGR